MEWTNPVVWIVGVAATAAVGVAKFSLGTRKILADHKTYAAENFATKDELIRATDNLANICSRIERKLDSFIMQGGKE